MKSKKNVDIQRSKKKICDIPLQKGGLIFNNIPITEHEATKLYKHQNNVKILLSFSIYCTMIAMREIGSGRVPQPKTRLPRFELNFFSTELQ